MPSRPPAVTRRAVVGALVLGTAGCSLDALDPTSDDPTLSPSPGPTVSGAPSPSGTTEESGETDDAALVAGVLSALALAHRTVRANARVHALGAVLRPLERLHLTHADELGDLPRTTGRVADPADSRRAALARVERAEARLQRDLVDAATAAGSGALARTLASMAAATAQWRTTLDAGADR